MVEVWCWVMGDLSTAHRATFYHATMKTGLLSDPIGPVGPVLCNIYVLGERAGKTEHCQGVPFVGDAGKILRKWFEDVELDFDNCRRWNVCIDYHPRNKKPLVKEIERDRLKVEADITRCQPKVIVAVGVHATKWCLKKPDLTLNKVHGAPVDVRIGDHQAVCVPVYHPSRLNIRWAEMGKADVLTVAQVLRSLIA
jgi:uracil-DNA glycosylase